MTNVTIIDIVQTKKDKQNRKHNFLPKGWTLYFQLRQAFQFCTMLRNSPTREINLNENERENNDR